MEKHHITWWNVENLFDAEGSDQRPEWLAKELKSELKGWTQEVLDKKISNLSSVIKKINDGLGPDILGVCEIENLNVLELLANNITAPGRDYGIIHQDMDDKRGIDIAFIYDKNKYTKTGKVWSLEVMKRNATRDILQAQLLTSGGNELILLGNHWPARSAGVYESEPYRIIVGETLSYWLKRIQEEKGKKANILVMGDFNDQPFDRSLTDYALSTIERKKVTYGRNPYLYNLMWEMLGTRQTSYFFDSEPLAIDQFLVSKGIAISNGVFQIPDQPVTLEIFEGMTGGRYNKPVRYGRPSSKKTYNPDGFSDHLPVSLTLMEK